MTCLAELWHVDQPGEILQVHTFIIELPEAVVLGVVPLVKRLECLRVVGSWLQTCLLVEARGGRATKRTPIHGTQHGRDKSVNIEAFLDKRYQSRYSAFVGCRAAETSKDELLKRLDFVLQIHEIANRFIPMAEMIFRGSQNRIAHPTYP